MKSIRWKITLSYLGLAAITLVITGVLLLVSTRILSRQVQEDELRKTAIEILPEIQAALLDGEDPSRVRETIRLLESAADIELLFVGPAGEEASNLPFPGANARDPGRMGPGERRRIPQAVELERMLQWLNEYDRRTIRPPGNAIPPGTFRIQIDDASGYVEIRDSAGLSDRFTRLVGMGFLIAAVVTLAASAGIGVLVGGGVTRPIRALTGAVGRMQAGDLEARAPVTTGDEIGTLATQFNTMASELGRTVAELRRERDTLRTFLADASHELRTPLTAISTFVELLEAEQPGRETLSDIRGQLNRMKHTVDSLLKLSRLESGVASLAIDKVELANVIEVSWASARHRGGSDAVLDIKGSAVLDGDAGQLEVLFENLISNSLQAGSTHLVCTIEAQPDPVNTTRWCVVYFTDNGAGIQPDELDQVFDRFYRGSKTAAGGSGLGLAIAESIALAHGGTITARSPADGKPDGTTVELRLPF